MTPKHWLDLIPKYPDIFKSSLFLLKKHFIENVKNEAEFYNMMKKILYDL